ncbi:MAG: DUF4364 family protein [Clostridiaceae bacterium]|jgi:hypothetical protein|nr:DUF4364 family protein [Clostridiaceae bacterium]
MNSLGSNKEIVQNKLIIMYIIQGLNMPVSNIHITRLILETRLMNYFMLQQSLNELHEGKLVSLSHGQYILTGAGAKALQYFLNLIPPGIKKQLDKVASSNRKDIREETLITADFIPESEVKFTVSCGIKENDFALIELKAAVGTKKEARSVCENWKKHSSEIYMEIIEALTKNRE